MDDAFGRERDESLVSHRLSLDAHMSTVMRPFFLALCGYVLLAPVMVWPVTNLPRLGAASYGGDALQDAWILAWNNHVLLSGGLSYFDANIYYPAPQALAGVEHLFGIGLFTLPIYAVTGDALLTYDIAWLASFPACGLAAFGLASLVTAGFLPRFIAGLIYAFAFFRFQHALHINLLWAFGLPLSLLALYRWRQHRSLWRAGVWALVVTLQALSSWYLAILCVVSNALWLAWLILLHPIPRADRGPVLAAPRARGSTAAQSAWSRGVLPLLVVMPAIALTLYWFARPYIGHPASPPEEILGNAATSWSYVIPPRATFFGQVLLASGVTLPEWSFETTNFLGFVAIGLAVTGLAGIVAGKDPRARQRSSVVTFFALLGNLAWLLSLGPHQGFGQPGSFDWTPYGLLAQLPGMAAFRVPARFALLVVLAVAILGAAGAEAIARRRRGQMLLLCAMPVLLLETFPIAYQFGRPREVKIPAVYKLLRELPPGPVVSLPAFTAPPEGWFEAEYLLFSTVHWNPIVNGYSRFVPPGHAERMRVIAVFPAPQALDELQRLGVRYVVTHARRYGVDLRPAIARAVRSEEVDLVARTEDDYLWRVRSTSPAN